MGQNLTGQTIASTYEDLVQISGSVLTDGTGSDITNLTITVTNATQAVNATSATSASYAIFATSASHALNANTANSAGTSTSASHAINSDNAISSSYALTASYAANVPDTASFAISASHANNANSSISASYALNATTSTSSSYALTASYAENAGVTVNTGSLLVTASISNATITFTKGDASTFPITVNNVSNASTASIATSASYALTASYLEGYSIPTLQQVTTAGATTDQTITVTDGLTASTLIAGTGTIIEMASNDGTTPLALNFVDSLATPLAGISLDPATSVLSITANGGATLQGNADTATSASHALNANSALSASVATSASHALIADNLVSGANINITSITASGAEFTNLIATSASIGFLQTVTGSATIIGDAFIILNTSNATRYAGIKVEDSGSATPVNYTASLQFDSLNNDWFYEYTSSGDPDNFGVVLFGPEYNAIGVPTYPTNNRLVKGDGGHHLNDSTISDDGTLVTIDANVSASGYVSASQFVGNLTGNATTATSASHAVNADSAISASYAPFTTPDLQAVTSVGALTSASVTFTDGVAASSVIAGTGVSFEFYSNDDTTPLVISYYDSMVTSIANISLDPATSTLGITANGGITLQNNTIISGSLEVTSGITGSLEGTASFATSASFATTASFALNASAFPFTGSARITGSLVVTGSYSRLSGSFSGSLIDNITDVYTTSDPVEHIITLTQAEYNLISSSADPSTLYYITDAISFVESASYALSSSYALTASLAALATTASYYNLTNVNQDVVITGSLRGNVSSVLIGSNTASLDFSSANFFSLTIVSGSDTHIAPTNILPGQTVNVLITQPNPGNGTVSFPSATVKQASGSAYVATTGSGAFDILTFIAFDNTTTYLSNIKNFI